MKNLIKPFLIVVFFATLVYWMYPKNQEKPFELIGNTQGTTYSIKYFAANEVVTKKSVDSILQLFDAELSTYIPDSKISKINNGDTTVIVNQWFKEVYNLSYQVYQETNGLFDPSIGILVNAYGFGPKKVTKMPTDAEIYQLLQKVGFNKIKIDENGKILLQKDMILDFNAIAQGYAVDVLANYLKSKKINHAMVEIGGEVFAFGQNLKSQKPWTIGIEDPLQKENNRAILEKVTIKNKGLATSGNYRKIKTDSITGEKYVHTLNPKTGISENSKILSATVITKSAALADAYATSFMLMNLAEIQTFIQNKPEIEVIIVYQNEKMEVEVFKKMRDGK